MSRSTPFLALLASLALVGGCKSSHAAPALDVLGQVPAFSFTDQTGAQVTSKDLTGHVVIADFIFTRCPTICPTVELKMERIGKKLDGLGDKLRMVSFSVDPEHDTPPVMATFAARYHADPAHWKFLTGPLAEVKHAAEDGLHMSIERKGTAADGTPDIAHDTHFVLIDQKMRIRGYYDSSDGKRLDQLVADARALANSGA